MGAVGAGAECSCDADQSVPTQSRSEGVGISLGSGMPRPGIDGRLSAGGAGQAAASIESASGTAGVGGVRVAGDIAAVTATRPRPEPAVGPMGRSCPRNPFACRATRRVPADNQLDSLWPKRDRSLTELLRRARTSKCPGTLRSIDTVVI